MEINRTVVFFIFIISFFLVISLFIYNFQSGATPHYHVLNHHNNLSSTPDYNDYDDHQEEDSLHNDGIAWN
jgi:hypothetical protein